MEKNEEKKFNHPVTGKNWTLVGEFWSVRMPIGIIYSPAVLPLVWLGKAKASGAPVLLLSPVWISSFLPRVHLKNKTNKKTIIEKEFKNTTTTTQWNLLCSNSGMFSGITPWKKRKSCTLFSLFCFMSKSKYLKKSSVAVVAVFHKVSREGQRGIKVFREPVLFFFFHEAQQSQGQL